MYLSAWLSRNFMPVSFSLQEGRYDVVDVLVHCTAGCPLTVSARSDGLPVNLQANSSVSSIVCDTGPCLLTYTPIQETCQYIDVDFADSFKAAFSLTVTAVKCRKPRSRPATEADMVMKKRMLRDRQDAERRWDRRAEISNSSVVIPDVTLANESFYHEDSQSPVGPLEVIA